MKKLKILLVVFLSVFSIFGFVGCKNKDDNLIRISEVTHSLFYAPLYVAINNGYFADEGLQIELTNAGGSDTVMGLSEKTGLPFHIAEDPLRAIARGTGIALKNIDRFSFLMKG